MDRIDRMIETQSIHQISERGIDDVRKSRDLLRKTPALVQTHHEALRMSKDKPLEFIRKSQQTAENFNIVEEKTDSNPAKRTNSLRESRSMQDLPLDHQGAEDIETDKVMALGVRISRAKMEL